MFAVHNAHTKCCRNSGGAAYESRKDQESNAILSKIQAASYKSMTKQPDQNNCN